MHNRGMSAIMLFGKDGCIAMIKRDRMPRRAFALFILLALLASLFAGCAGKTVQEPEKPREPAPAQTPAQSEPAPTQETDKPPEVENNGGRFVRVGDRVYFREYGSQALDKTVVFGEFTEHWNVLGGESKLKALDLATGKTETLFVESGDGALWYGDGGFYLTERINNLSRVGWYAADGSDSDILCTGEVLGMTEGGLLAVQDYADEQAYHAIYTFYRDKKPVCTADCYSFMNLAGLSDDGLFFLDYYKADDGALHLRQLTTDGRLLDLGAIPEGDEDYAFYDVEPERFLTSSGRVTVGVGCYAGTGHYLEDGLFIEAESGKENSLREIDVDLSEAYELPRLTLGANGNAETVPALPGELRVGLERENEGSLEVWRDGEWKTVSEHIISLGTEGYGYRNIVQSMEMIGGTAYLTLACAHLSPLDSIGWRDAYALLDMLYLAVDADGTVRELGAVDHGTELYGDVWFIEGASTLLWRQSAEEGKEYLFDDDEAYYAVAIPIFEDAYWEGGWEAVIENHTGLIGEEDVGDAGYYGYEVPDAEPAGKLCLELNREGEVVAIAKKTPGALLAIDFQVSEYQLSGAVKTLPLERRDADEDTAWFWTKLRALEDGVCVRVERTPSDGGMTHLALIEGAFPVGETVYEGVINRGEFIALRASAPWHGELRVSVSKNGDWGAYVFGEDNYLHLDVETGIHPTVTVEAAPAVSLTEYAPDGMPNALLGTWQFLSPETGRLAATVRFDADGTAYVNIEDDCWQFDLEFDWLYAGDWQAPDLMCLSSGDERVSVLLGYSGGAGDYIISVYRTDGEELLHLTQANNGDAILDKILPGTADKGQFDFTFFRSSGAGSEGAYRRNASFVAVAARYDVGRGTVWLREAEQVDVYEDGRPFMRAARSAPCLEYRISSAEAERLLASCRDSARPMCLFNVTTDSDGTVTQLSLFD